MTKIVLPSRPHMEWADSEIGVIIHLDIEVFQPEYDIFNQTMAVPPVALFNPHMLDTDQWIETAVAAGAKYAILVAKHCTGFSLWPTAAHDYSVKATPWRNGKGDIVADFMGSCSKYGIKSGLYASTGRNALFKVFGNVKEFSPSSKEWLAYSSVLTAQLKELWTQYGKLFEVWFDGGNLSFEYGGDKIAKLLCQLQPQAIVFQGNPELHHTVRWVGNELGYAPEACWSTSDIMTESDGMRDVFGGYPGSSGGRFWCPAEADMPNRDILKAYSGGWFWREGEDHLLYRPETLVNHYFETVGRNSNLLLGMAIDNQGLVPDSDVAQYKKFGSLIKEQFAHCRGKSAGTGNMLDMNVVDSAPVNCFSLQEDISMGERVLSFFISGFDGENYVPLVNGKNIGHKRLIRLPECRYSRYRLEIPQSKDEPQIREFAAWGHLTK